MQSLKAQVAACESRLTLAEKARADRAASFLSNGAPSYQMADLPQIYCHNDESVYQYGELLTDTLAGWVADGFLAGPFKSPPFPRFRVNPIKVVVKPDKVRPVLNVSSPIGASFNDNICIDAMEKVVMSSAKKFSESVLEAGKGALMTKTDKKDAYKNVPCNLKDLRLQGLQWGGRYFVELYQIFGSKAAAANYDTLDNTSVSLAKAGCEIPKKFVHRQLDDTPAVGPASKPWLSDFTTSLFSVCNQLGFKLAPECPKFEKAFTMSTRGKVLGIFLDTMSLSWSLPLEKSDEYLSMVLGCLQGANLSLEAAESLLGKLNFVTSMAPFMKTFKVNLQIFLATLKEAHLSSLELTAELRRDLEIWAVFLFDSREGLPIPSPRTAPPLRHKTVTTDASGWQNDHNGPIDAGIGVVVRDEDGELSFVSQTLWSFAEGTSLIDSLGKHLGSKTTSLELTGLVLAVLQLGNDIAGQHVVFQVDNIGCHYIWPKGYSNTDRLASVLARLLVLLEAKLCMNVHVMHHPRMSSWESCLADRLSRERSTTSSDKLLLSSFRVPPLQRDFAAWMRNPSEDWDMPLNVISNF